MIAAFKDAIRFSPTGTLDSVAIFAGVDASTNLVGQVRESGMASLDREPSPPDTSSVDFDLTGTIYTMYLTLHYFKMNPSGAQTLIDKSLIFVSSMAAYIDDTHDSSYTASKFGMRGLWRSVRDRAAELGVRCNSVAPWAMITPMTAHIIELIGLEDGKGITFPRVEVLVQARVRCVADKSVNGRTFAIMPEGFCDIGDDLKGGYGGSALPQLMAMRCEGGDLLSR